MSLSASVVRRHFWLLTVNHYCGAATMMMLVSAAAAHTKMLSTVRSRFAHKSRSSLLRHRESTVEALVVASNGARDRFFSSNNSSGNIPFTPRRRASKEYRPLKPRPTKKKGPLDPYITENPLEKKIVLGEVEDASDELEETFGTFGADAIRHTIKERNERGGKPLDPEELLKMADYITAEAGSTEDLVGERRALALDGWDDEDREEYLKEVDEFIEKERINQMGLDEQEAMYSYTKEEDDVDDDEEDPEEQRDINQIAHGDW